MAPVLRTLNWLRASARRYRWVVWCTMALAYMIVFLHRLAAGVVRDDLVDSFGITGTSFGHLASMYFYAYLIMQIPVGMLADTQGSRITVSAGIMLSGIGSIIFGFAPSVFWAYVGRFIVGIGVSTVFVCLLKILSEWYGENEFATMSGVTTFVGNLGGLIAQTPLAVMVVFLTWRTTFVLIGVISVFTSLACYTLIRNSPVDMGFNHADQNRAKRTVSTSELMPALKTVVLSSPIWPATAVVALFQGSNIAFTGAWGVPWLVDVYGLTRSEASALVSIAVLGAMVGGVFVGKLSDLMGSRKIPLLSVGVFNIIAWGVIVMPGAGKPPLALLKPALFVMGFASMALVLCLAIAKETNDPSYTGVALSVLNMGVFLGIAIFPPIMGMVIDLLSGHGPEIQYRGALFICFLGSLLGMIFAFRVPEPHCRNITVIPHEGPAGGIHLNP